MFLPALLLTFLSNFRNTRRYAVTFSLSQWLPTTKKPLSAVFQLSRKYEKLFKVLSKKFVHVAK